MLLLLLRSDSNIYAFTAQNENPWQVERILPLSNVDPVFQLSTSSSNRTTRRTRTPGIRWSLRWNPSSPSSSCLSEPSPESGTDHRIPIIRWPEWWIKMFREAFTLQWELSRSTDCFLFKYLQLNCDTTSASTKPWLLSELLDPI